MTQPILNGHCLWAIELETRREVGYRGLLGTWIVAVVASDIDENTFPDKAVEREVHAPTMAVVSGILASYFYAVAVDGRLKTISVLPPPTGMAAMPVSLVDLTGTREKLSSWDVHCDRGWAIMMTPSDVYFDRSHILRRHGGFESGLDLHVNVGVGAQLSGLLSAELGGGGGAEHGDSGESCFHYCYFFGFCVKDYTREKRKKKYDESKSFC